MKRQRLDPLPILLFALIFLSGCGGAPPRLPFETLSNAESWRLVYHYDYRGSDADRLRISAKHRRTLSGVRKNLEDSTKLAYLESPEADITVTLEERQRSSGYGQVNGLKRREIFWWVRFYARKGELLAEYNESRQYLMRQSDNQALIEALSEQIKQGLAGEKIQR